MSGIDWAVLIGTLGFIVIYGVWKSSGSKNIKGFLLGNKEARWWTVGLSVMATQASAITFLSTPGQAYHDGMGFVQFYFGLPIAMVIICITFIPIYQRLKVYTAYEFLEQRFDLKTRTFTASLFLIQRGLAAGITIYAPAIVLSSILGWNLNLTNILIGTLVIIYTVAGGTKAVNITQKQQMLVIMLGMFAAFYILLQYITQDYSFSEVLSIAEASGRLQVLDFSWDMNNRYTVWTGLIGGTFLALSYFGTDQSQVQRYLSGKSVRESRLGLIFNAIFKIPMQLFILFVGVMVFLFYQFNKPPVFFNAPLYEKVATSEYKNDILALEESYDGLFERKEQLNQKLLGAVQRKDRMQESEFKEQLVLLQSEELGIRNQVKEIVKKVDPQAETNDKDYVFITFILNYLPKGLVGLLLAVIFSAAMSSTASELNALASTTTVDLYKRSWKRDGDETHYLRASKLWTVFWGLVAILFASIGTLFENLIQFVNIIGSIFYGTILGVFLVGFYLKWIKSNAVFIAAVITQIGIIILFKMDVVGYLWLNFIGCAAVCVIASLISFIKND